MPHKFQSIEDFGVSRETFERLEAYQALLHKWQKAVNLVSPSTIAQSWERHFVDSAQLLPLIPQDVKIIADLGCGAGFPGLVLAMARPDLQIHLVESDDKKCQFMRTVSRETGVKVSIHNKRIEAAQGDIAPDLITARALASLRSLLDYTAGWAEANPALQFLFLKGAKAQQEIEEARSLYDFSYEIFESATEKEARILRLSGVKPLVHKDS